MPERTGNGSHSAPPTALALSLKFLDPNRLTLSRHKDGALLLEIKDEVVYIDVTCRLAFPISEPSRFLEFRDHGNKVIGVIDHVRDLDGKSLDVLEQELERSYFIPRVIEVEEMKSDAGAQRFVVETNRGPATFYVLNPHDDITRLSDGRLRLLDGFGNMYEILPWELDEASRDKVERIL